jgi:hypothetical protein
LSCYASTPGFGYNTDAVEQDVAANGRTSRVWSP